MQGKGLRDRASDFAGKNAVIVGVSFDAPAENKAFRDKFDFDYPLLTASPEMAMAYGAASDAGAKYPARAACVVRGDGTVHRWWGNVDAKTFAESVLAELP